MSHSALGPQFAMMRPSELLPYVATRPGGHSAGWHRIEQQVAQSIGKKGYRASMHEDDPGGGIDTHIHLAHHDDGPVLANGNHRVHAMNRIGYDKPVKVRVTDYRTKGIEDKQ